MLYYQDSAPKISDAKFDLLKNEILELESKYNFKNKSSPSKTVGFKLKGIWKVWARSPILSLSNAFNLEDLLNFEKDFNYLNKY